MTLSSTVIPTRSVSESKHAGFLPHLHLPALHICATPEQPPPTIHSNATKTCYSYIYIQIIYHLKLETQYTLIILSIKLRTVDDKLQK